MTGRPETTEDSHDLAERALRRRKREDLALVLPAFGALLLVSPFIDVVSGPGRVFGIPASFVYIFLVWTVGIVLTRFLARRLIAGEEPGGNEG